MKISIIILIVIYLFSYIKTIDINANNTNVTNIDKNINNTKNETMKEKKKKKKKKNKIRTEEPKFEPVTSGVYINETIFDEKLKNIIEEKNLKPNKKITKLQLKTIFILIYKREEKPGEIRKTDPETGLTPEEQSDKFMDTLFNKVVKGLDYDDKIKVKEIKEWIPPKKTQEAYDELLYSLAEEMGYL